MRLDVVLPAGGRVTGDFAAESIFGPKALISFDGRTVLERTLTILRLTGMVARIVVVGPSAVLTHGATKLADKAIVEGQSGPENIM
jgi:2-C-methyl-D-erythritol 4-phosphate cytidylyltransferase